MTDLLSLDELPWTGFLDEECLPAQYQETAIRWYQPLLQHIIKRCAAQDRPLLLGVNGCQGSGKSTLAALLEWALPAMAGLRVVSLSLDDFYLTKAERQWLATEVHPLLATRGVPGTHDVDLMAQVIEKLMSKQCTVSVPRFDKAADDRTVMAHWHQVGAPVDLVIWEGWCLGVGPQTEGALTEPVNQLEQTEDPHGLWRGYVNKALSNDYQPLYDLVDLWVMLAAPGFECVHNWRCEQEEKLAQVAQGDRSGLMNPEQITRFIAYYQRLTEWGLATLPDRVDYLYRLNTQRGIESISVSQRCAP